MDAPFSADSRARESAGGPSPLPSPRQFSSSSPPPQPATPTLIPPTPSPPPSPTLSSSRPPQPRHFFAAWQLRNARRAALWHSEASEAVAGAGSGEGGCEGMGVIAAPEPAPATAAPAAAPGTQLTTLHHKLQHLKAEIASLVAQDIALFRQLFSLQEAILELREQFELSSCSSGDSSPCSTLSSSSSFSNLGMVTKVRHSSSFVRHHVSYPPIARNRSYRIKSTAPHHGCQDSYDSGIHNSDHEIFV